MAKTIQAILNLKDNFSNTLKKTTSQTQKFQRQLKQTSNSVKEMQSAILGSFGRIAGGIGLLEIGKQSIMLASNLAEVQNVVDVTFGGSAETINNWSKNALKSFGLSELQAKKFNGTMGALIKSSGISGDKMVDMSQKLTGLSADFASFYNLDSEEAFDKIKSGISGETEPLKSLGINMSVANLEAYALTQGITKQWKAMSQAEQVQLRYNYLMMASKDAQGDFTRTSGGFANQLRIAQENLKQLGASLGALVLPGLNALLINFNKLVDFAPQVGAVFTNLFKNLSNVQSVKEGLYLIFITLNQHLFRIAPNVSEVFSRVTNIIADNLGGIVDNAIRIGQDLATPFMDTFNTIIQFCKLAGSSILETMSAVNSNTDMVGMFNILRDILAGVLSDIRGVFNFFNENWSLVAPILAGLVGGLIAYNLALKTVTVTMQVVKAVQEAWAVITGVCNTAMLILNGTLQMTPFGKIALLIGILIGVGIALYENWDVICAKASELWATVTTAFNNIGQSISQTWTEVKTSIGEAINYCIDKINNLINGFNSLANFSLPDWLGGGSVGVEVPNIPKFATGTQYFSGGLAQINERGGEIVNLPNGSQVIPADKTDKILNGSGGTIVNVTVQGNVIGNHQFVNEMGEIITGKIKLALVNN
ncbi:hypothetical protein ACN077_20730 [Clostridium chromiireducens]|uniref:hypothetical protein n=1 Tax=Clostridium chromiireducens TaxID=225345 RepID=UPI003AF6B01C